MYAMYCIYTWIDNIHAHTNARAWKYTARIMQGMAQHMQQ